LDPSLADFDSAFAGSLLANFGINDREYGSGSLGGVLRCGATDSDATCVCSDPQTLGLLISLSMDNSIPARALANAANRLRAVVLK